MILKKLQLQNFRSYSDRTFEFDDKLNVLVGKNAQGKTNVLEAIFFCVLGKSFKTSKEKEVIKIGTENAYVKADFSKKYRDTSIEILFNSLHKKTVKINSISIKRIGELLSETNAVFFSPDELKLVKDSPEERRRFMNISISQTNKAYFYNLSRYEKVLASRNKLLKSTKDISVVKETVDIWDRALASLAEKIFLERKKFIDEILPYAQMAHQYISSGSEEIDIKYISSFDSNYEANMLKALQKNIEKEEKTNVKRNK